MQLQLKRISSITLASALLVCMVFVYRLSSAYTRAPWLAKPRATIAITVYPSTSVKSPARRPTSIPTSISVANASTQVQTGYCPDDDQHHSCTRSTRRSTACLGSTWGDSASAADLEQLRPSHALNVDVLLQLHGYAASNWCSYQAI